MASEKLLPCPFERGTCGRNALSIQTTPDPKGRTGVRAGWVCCHDCGTRGPLAYADEADIQEVAAYNWNDRAALSQGQDGAVSGALETADSWLERWAKHVGSCEGGDHCTCGLTRVRFEVDAAIRSALVSHEPRAGGAAVPDRWTKIGPPLDPAPLVIEDDDPSPAQEAGAEPSKQAVEAVAEVFYDSFVYGLSGEKPKWVEGGNSLVQDEARRYAHRALRALAPEGRT